MPRSASRSALRALGLVVGISLLLTACAGRPSPTTDPSGSSPSPGSVATTGTAIPVVAAENVYGDLLTQICGARCAVTSILRDPNADPHEYESSAQDAVAVANARLVIENGLGYDAFMARLLSASPDPRRRVLDVQTLVGAAAGANPHLWYDTGTMAKVAQAAAADLASLDPAHAQQYQAAERRFLASLQAVTAEVASIRRAYPRVPVAYTEPVFGYMGRALGLDVLTPQSFQRAIEDGNDPSAPDMATEQELLQRHQVRVLIYNLQTVTPLTTGLVQLARSDGIPTVGVTETEPPGQTYRQWTLNKRGALRDALAGGAAAGGH